MAKLKMLCSTIYAHKSKRNELLSYLQRKGVIEIAPAEFDNDQLINSNSDNAAAQFKNLAGEVSHALECLSSSTGYKPPLFSYFRARNPLSPSDYNKIHTTMPEVHRTAMSFIDMDAQIKHCKIEINKQQSIISALKAWDTLDILLNTSGTQFTSLLLGSFNGLRLIENIADNLQKLNSNLVFDVGIVDATKNKTNVYCICLSSQLRDMEAALLKAEFMPLTFKPELTALQQIEQAKQRIKDMEHIIERLNGFCKAGEQHRQDLEYLYDYAVSKQMLNEEIAKMRESSNIIIIKGYIPKKYLNQIVDDINTKFLACIELHEPDPDDELLPVALENNAFSAPVQSMVETYSMPAKSDIDPTSLTSIFFYLFFGFMFSDVGYGLIMVIVSMLAVWRLKPEPKAKNNLMLFFYCGLASIVWGIIFGSYFGNAITMFTSTWGAEPIVMPSLINPLLSPITMLLLSIALGLVHIFTGLGVKFYQIKKLHSTKDAVFDAGFWMIFIIGLVILCTNIFTPIPVFLLVIGSILAIGSGVGLIITQGRHKKNVVGKALGGVGSLYGVSGYLSDVMSYSRLMALGISTGVIAAVINQISFMFTDGFAIIAFIIIFVFGHALNFGINALGAYVHTMRLQYVEFYSKFYNGQSPMFKPLTTSTKYSKIVED